MFYLRLQHQVGKYRLGSIYLPELFKVTVCLKRRDGVYTKFADYFQDGVRF